MSRKGKIEAEEKIRIVQECIEGKLSQAQAAEAGPALGLLQPRHRYHPEVRRRPVIAGCR